MVFASVAHSDIYVSGDVRIDPSAVIAPGVIIQAAADGYVAIAAGVCLGMGAILQAHQGNIEICQGAMIGAGVLIVGNATIGENACIGYGTTIFRTSILATTVIPPNSLLGDISRQPGKTNQTIPDQRTQNQLDQHKNKAEKKNIPKAELFTNSQDNTATDPWGEEPPITQPPITDPLENFIPAEFIPAEFIPAEFIPAEINTPPPDDKHPEEQQEQAKEEEKITIPDPPETLEKEPVNTKKAPVVGQVYINQLLMTLFPHNNQIHPPDNT